ncbi:MAG: nickel pincer cofactor biosynthesis protein LarC [Thaumarchaeota archaeon]|nr:nickel pincer cofactor biosynthesis protein LarC [Nitrososphaerota archaeon]
MVLVIDPQIAGISGDMLLCSLVDMGADKAKIINGIKACSEFLKGSTIQSIDFNKVDKNGTSSTELFLNVNEISSTRKGSDIREAIVSATNHLSLSDGAKLFATSCIDSLISSESKIHGVSAESVHLHEASSIDTLVDIIGTAISLEDLGLLDEDIVCMPVAVGSGFVEFSHGVMSNPASAVLEILKGSGLHICGSSVKEELTTPTGACLLKGLAAVSVCYYPYMTVESTGYGAGKKDIGPAPNVLKLVRGDAVQISETESVKILETNIDDVSGEILGNLVEKIMNDGAKDVSIYPGITKKNRPTSLVSIMCNDESVNSIVSTLVRETGTLGIRIRDSNRIIIPRKTHHTMVEIDGRKFNVRYKTSLYGGQTNLKVEFDDLKNISSILHKSLKEAEYLVRREIDKNDARNS